MRFIGVSAPRQAMPTVEIVASGRGLDLHNDADLQELRYDYEDRTLRLVWALGEPAWTAPDRPEPSARRVGQSATLVISGIRALRIAGSLVTSGAQRAGELDHFEFRELEQNVGELRFVFDNDAELVVVGESCELLLTRGD